MTAASGRTAMCRWRSRPSSSRTRRSGTVSAGQTQGQWTAEQQINIVANSEADAVARIFAAYRDAWAGAHGSPVTAKLGMARHMVVAETSAEAERIAEPAFNQWRTSLAKLWRDNGADPIRFPKDYAEAKARRLTLAGSPADVQAALGAQSDRHPRQTMSFCRFAFGSLADGSAAKQSLDLFVRDVAPAFPGALAA